MRSCSSAARPLGARGRQRPAGPDGDAPLDLVLPDRPVAVDEHVAHPVVGDQLHGQRHAAAGRGALADVGAVADGVQRLGEARDGADRLADPIARARLDERLADRRDRGEQRQQLVVGIDALRRRARSRRSGRVPPESAPAGLARQGLGRRPRAPAPGEPRGRTRRRRRVRVPPLATAAGLDSKSASRMRRVRLTGD